MFCCLTYCFYTLPDGLEVVNDFLIFFFVVEEVVFVGMIFLGLFIRVNGEPTVVVFLFHPNQLAATVNFCIGLHDIPWFNRLTFVFHLGTVSQTFQKKSTEFQKFFK